MPKKLGKVLRCGACGFIFNLSIPSQARKWSLLEERSPRAAPFDFAEELPLHSSLLHVFT